MNRKNLRDVYAVEQGAYHVMRPIVRVLRACGLSQTGLLSAVRRASARYTKSPVKGVWIEDERNLELADVVMIWARDVDFIDESGQPLKLNLRGSGKSFPELLRRANVSMRPHQALRYLLSLGSVRLCDRGRRVRLVSHVLLTVMRNRFLISPILKELKRFAETIEHNICEAPGPMEGRMHRWAQNACLTPRQLPEVQRFVRLSGQTFLDSVDEKLSACAAKTGRSGVKYGVGVYVFVEKPDRTRRKSRRSKESNS